MDFDRIRLPPDCAFSVSVLFALAKGAVVLDTEFAGATGPLRGRNGRGVKTVLGFKEDVVSTGASTGGSRGISGSLEIAGPLKALLILLKKDILHRPFIF